MLDPVEQEQMFETLLPQMETVLRILEPDSVPGAASFEDESPCTVATAGRRYIWLLQLISACDAEEDACSDGMAVVLESYARADMEPGPELSPFACSDARWTTDLPTLTLRLGIIRKAAEDWMAAGGFADPAPLPPWMAGLSPPDEWDDA